MSFKVLGIHDGHNASACLVEDGVLTHCVQEERFTNVKNIIGFPEKSIEYILKDRKIVIEDIDVVAWSSKFMVQPFDPKEMIAHYKRQYSDPAYAIRLKAIDLVKKYGPFLFDKKVRALQREREKKIRKFGNPKSVTFVDHHLSHAAAAYYGSGFKEDVLVLTLDGGGDWLVSTVYVGRDGKLEKLAETPDGHSIGNIYSRTTYMLGFTPLEHEYKLMGMAPYTKDQYSDRALGKYRKYLDLDPANPLVFKRTIKTPTHHIYPVLRKDFELERFDNVCAGLQRFTEELVLKWVRKAIEKTGIHTVALSGGVFMNVKANKLVMESKLVKKLFVMPSPGDETNPIGAAYHVYAQESMGQGRGPGIRPFTHLYLGYDATPADAKRALETFSEKSKLKVETERPGNTARAVAELLAEHKVVARCSGRMEFGARALGNRSILANASDLGCVREINMMVKKRDFWMPFAPAILRERMDDYLINPKNMDSPYMVLSFDTTDKRDEIIAAVHMADLTARPQTVTKEWNGGYYDIIKEYEGLTGIGGILNTSFNLHGYPIVKGPEEALWVFENSGLAYLVLGDRIVSKPSH
ncbi:MAG: carbamoyltransferase C-terminal domain-containing protein [Candidatus Thermoplasmatota archaeon]